MPDFMKLLTVFKATDAFIQVWQNNKKIYTFVKEQPMFSINVAASL